MEEQDRFRELSLLVLFMGSPPWSLGLPCIAASTAPKALIRPSGWDARGAGMAPSAPGAPGQLHPWDPPHREGAAKCSCSPCQPLIVPHRALGSAQGAAFSGTQRRDSPGWFGHDSVTFCHVRACPGLPCCGACAWGWSSSAWESFALQGCCGLHMKDGALEATPGAHHPSPCLSHAPELPALPSPQPQVPGTRQNLAPGAAAGTRQCCQAQLVDGQLNGCPHWPAGAGHWKLCGGSIPGASSPSPVYPAPVALIHIFIRINEACNKCIGEAKQAAERQRQWMTAGEEEDNAVYCADLGSSLKPHVHSLAGAAREQCALPVYMLPNTCTDTQKCSFAHRHVSAHTGIKRDRLTRDQPSMFKKSH